MEEQNKTREEEQEGVMGNEEKSQSQSQTSEIKAEDNVATSVGETKTQSAQSETTPTSEVENGDDKDKDIEENKFIASLSYLGILVLVPLLVKKDSKFSQFHAKQGLVLLIIWVVGWVFFWIPVFGQILLLALMILNIIAFAQALSGKYWEIPVISDWAKKINL